MTLSGVDGLSESLDRLQRAVEMRPRLGMHRDAVAAGIGEGGDVGIDGRNHQVTVEHLVRAVADRLDDGRPEGDVGHEMPVHDVEMDPVRAGSRHRLDLFAELREIR
jgi:hypothetical protein